MKWYIGTEWQMERKGLHKKVLDLTFSKVDKPHAIAKVIINVDKVENLNGRQSAYLTEEKVMQDQSMEMGTGLFPIDCYLEMFVQQMIVGETALCTIKTKKAGEEVRVTLKLKDIQDSKSIHTLNVPEIFDLALKYKENGVKMFKSYPVFAHEYFAKAAKCLISYKEFENLTKKEDGVAGKDMNDLMLQIQTNLAACLLSAKRYDDVLYQTKFVETMSAPLEKSIYRRAMAFYQKKDYDLALKTMEKAKDYKSNKDFVNLHQKIIESRKSSDAVYKGMVQKMFG